MSGLHTDTAGSLPTAVPQAGCASARACGHLAPGAVAPAPGVLSRHGQPWTSEELAQLRAYLADDKSTRWIGRAMGRTREAIMTEVKRRGLGPVHRPMMNWDANAIRTLIRMRSAGEEWDAITAALGCGEKVAERKWQELRRVMIAKGYTPPDIRKVKAERQKRAIRTAWDAAG